MFVYIVHNFVLVDEHNYRERFHVIYKEYKAAKEYINNYLETLQENNSVKVIYELEDTFNETYRISCSFNGYHRTIKEHCTITRERVY